MSLSDLLSAADKAAELRVIRDLTLDMREFGQLIEQSMERGFVHERLVKEWPSDVQYRVPEFIDRIVKGQSGDDKAKASAKRAFNAIASMFGPKPTRRLVCAHFFSKTDGTKWHLFYFDGSDYNGLHWDGCHVHYCSSLWGHDIEQLKVTFQTSRTFNFSTEHLRIVPFPQS